MSLRYQDWEWQLKITCPRCGGLPEHLSSHCHGTFITIYPKSLEFSGASISPEYKTEAGNYRVFALMGWTSGVYCKKCNLIYCHLCKEHPELVGRKSWKLEDDSGIG